jgi:hypothetical protein
MHRALAVRHRSGGAKLLASTLNRAYRSRRYDAHARIGSSRGLHGRDLGTRQGSATIGSNCFLLPGERHGRRRRRSPRNHRSIHNGNWRSPDSHIRPMA